MRTPLYLAFLALLGVPLAAQGTRDHPSRWQPALGLYVGSPQRASLAVGVLWVARRAPDFSSVRGPRLLAEPGLRAGKLRAGYAVSGAFATGYALEAAVLREWRGGRRGATLYGGEVHGSLTFVDVGIGAYVGAGRRGRLAFSAGLVL